MERIKTEYIRNLKGSYMVIATEYEPEPFQEKMLRHNPIEGVLVPFSETRDMERKLWYEITGKQSLELVLSNQEMGQELFCQVLSQLCSVVEKLDAFLLNENGILLEAESIFIDRGIGQVVFTYLPGKTGALAASLQRFVEYLLSKIDHKDTAAVKIAYEVYEKTLKEGYTLADIRESIKLPYEREESSAVLESRTDRELPVNRSFVEEPTVGALVPLKEQWVKCQKFWKNRLARGRRRIRKEPIVFTPESEPENIVHPTVLLSEVSEPQRGILHYEGTGSGSDITIDKTPFVIGSDPSCDACIRNRAVSRQHARITQTEDIYFIEDLNSSNGTTVGGELLNYKTRVSLQTNEVILFANEKYRFL